MKDEFGLQKARHTHPNRKRGDSGANVSRTSMVRSRLSGGGDTQQAHESPVNWLITRSASLALRVSGMKDEFSAVARC